MATHGLWKHADTSYITGPEALMGSEETDRNQLDWVAQGHQRSWQLLHILVLTILGY